MDPDDFTTGARTRGGGGALRCEGGRGKLLLGVGELGEAFFRSLEPDFFSKRWGDEADDSLLAPAGAVRCGACSTAGEGRGTGIDNDPSSIDWLLDGSELLPSCRSSGDSVARTLSVRYEGMMGAESGAGDKDGLKSSSSVLATRVALPEAMRDVIGLAVTTVRLLAMLGESRTVGISSGEWVNTGGGVRDRGMWMVNDLVMGVCRASFDFSRPSESIGDEAGDLSDSDDMETGTDRNESTSIFGELVLDDDATGMSIGSLDLVAVSTGDGGPNGEMGEMEGMGGRDMFGGDKVAGWAGRMCLRR